MEQRNGSENNARFPLDVHSTKKISLSHTRNLRWQFGRFLSLHWCDIFSCLLLQLLRVNLTSFRPPPTGRVAPSAAILTSFRPALPLSLMYLVSFLADLVTGFKLGRI